MALMEGEKFHTPGAQTKQRKAKHMSADPLGEDEVYPL